MNDSSRSVSVIIPAFNEEKNIDSALRNVVSVIESLTDDYEILVMDDGSKDRTASLVESYKQINPKVRLISNQINRGFGYSFRRGIELATKDYITGFPGDNDMSSSTLRDLVREAESVDLVISYMKIQNRSFLRRFISSCFIIFMNSLFGLHLKYYNGPFICRREMAQKVKAKSSGLAAVAEYVVRFIKSGCRYKEIPFMHVGRQVGKSSALTIKNIKSVLLTIFVLIKDIHFSHKAS